MKSVADLGIKYTGGDFNCSGKILTSLEGAPTKVSGSFYCRGNKLRSLQGAPASVDEDFNCNNNSLTSLQGAPTLVGGDFYCDRNRLTSLQGAPTEVGGHFACDNNRLTSLQGAPTKVGGGFFCHYNKLTSLKSVHRIIHEINGSFGCRNNPIKEGYLYILLIKGMTDVWSDFYNADEIVNEYLKDNPSGSMKAVLEVQALLEEANVEYPR